MTQRRSVLLLAIAVALGCADIAAGEADASAAAPRTGAAAQFSPADVAVSADLSYFSGGGSVNRLLHWIRAHDGVAHLEVKETCPGCMRGTLATKDFERGDLVASVPGILVVDIGFRSMDISDAAALWIKKMHTEEMYNSTFAPFLDTLPHAGEVLSPEMWSPELIAALQSEELAMIVSARVEEAEIAWREAGFDDGRPDGNGVAIKLPLDTFKHAIACIATRMYGYPSPLHNNEEHMQLLPVFDMANCADPGLAGPHDPGSNAEVQYPGEDGTFTMLAKWRIRKGEEVTNNYGHNYLHRPDMSLLVYGFVPSREPPILSTVDLPEGFGSIAHPQIGYPPTPQLEPDFGNAEGEFTTEAELQRLAGIYAGLPTTLEQDIALVDSPDTKDPQMRMVLQWRVGRKRALLAAMAQLSASLAARHKMWPKNQNYEPPAPGGERTRTAAGAAAAKQRLKMQQAEAAAAQEASEDSEEEAEEAGDTDEAEAAAGDEVVAEEADIAEPPADGADGGSAADGDVGPAGRGEHEEL